MIALSIKKILSARAVQGVDLLLSQCSEVSLIENSLFSVLPAKAGKIMLCMDQMRAFRPFFQFSDRLSGSRVSQKGIWMAGHPLS